MKEFTVKYIISDDMVQRLEKIVDHHHRCGSNVTVEDFFAMIMIAGSQYDIEDRFQIHERICCPEEE